MLFPFRLRPSPTKEKSPPPPPRPRPRDLPLIFWQIERHDRRDLITRIMPYMAEVLPSKDTVQAVLKKYPWVSAFIASEAASTATDDDATFSVVRKLFWEESRRTTETLLDVTRLWFFTLIRYTYRVRFLDGRRASRIPLTLETLYPNLDSDYGSELTEDDVYTLTRLPNRYGASLYRSVYKAARKRTAWKHFSRRILQFCISVGLDPSSRDPEIALQELRRSLSSGKLHHNVARKAERLIPTSSTLREPEPSSRSETEITSLSSDLHVENQDDKEEDQSSPVDVEQIMESLRTEYDGQLDELRDRLCHLTSREQLYAGGESLLACRWLLEHLPPKSTYGEGGYRWKRYWQKEWEKCTGKSLENHPLSELINEEKYNRIGENLYRTLSNRLHQYGARRGEKLDTDVQKVVDAIKPIHYQADGSIDLKAERQRWIH
ncbi:hypothetical protein K491DRAFT_760023 [Lophiostoma macrostomum CBS 122681]|uniref:Uncharacterized protein n=1 Tax=Lophiostoma macrostomum CBS 122681 TaxID=1314788 RepID=A0A6A6SYW1_9PLEO|nr:hypothetical protein K491DRAFT_760023 [Lophiostoma macrostomum CBS 122681]